ncbi:aldo/keto reductase [Pararhizobium mangrovi]|uniref:Aldo/keto reductase n=1 Tax=Pararhizobium mangrovi TaxID=2590452 RepID=A0A506TXX0_9HYPH|nr:aldo/keto reductase [Pararhizobium mangrovi]TPW26923.1 aldo/keto reductase [Pararhizobium mangrovi]
MQTRRFGTTAFETSVIGQGTWHLDHADRASAVAALRHGLDYGMSHIDTAEMYGEAEPVIGEAIEGRRDEVFLVSKVLPHNASRSGTIEACERSLRRLRTDRLDSYLLHWPGRFRLEETFEAFDRLQSDGKIRSFGVSNFGTKDLDRAYRIAGDRIACNQVLYHLKERTIEHSVLPWCVEHGIALTAYSPFGHDAFPDEASEGGHVLSEIAATRDATPRQVVLAFLTRNPAVFAIPKASKTNHVEDNAAASDLHLSEDEIDRIDTAFVLGKEPASLPIL